ncbi:unnamed protein product [Dracunculus medinensis]|uniref:Uncharacterized protein n=1 Tax=Dracunculus medinensis TaxID=318479 RepID=A0A0N4UCX7_DRAME|nr:unnamed protein product [Dracunculus medinensis]
MLQPKSKCSFSNLSGRNSQSPVHMPAIYASVHNGVEQTIRSSTRPQWTLASNAFHQSFDDRNQASPTILSNSCGTLDDAVSNFNNQHLYNYIERILSYQCFNHSEGERKIDKG